MPEQPSPNDTAELDLMIHDMQFPESLEHAKAILDGLPGIVAVRIIPGGAWIKYRPSLINVHQIRTSLVDADFRAATFQDSATGKTGVSSQ